MAIKTQREEEKKFVPKLQNEETSVRKFWYFCKTLMALKYSVVSFIVLRKHRRPNMNNFLPKWRTDARCD